MIILLIVFSFGLLVGGVWGYGIGRMQKGIEGAEQTFKRLNKWRSKWKNFKGGTITADASSCGLSRKARPKPTDLQQNAGYRQWRKKKKYINLKASSPP